MLAAIVTPSDRATRAAVRLLALGLFLALPAATRADDLVDQVKRQQVIAAQRTEAEIRNGVREADRLAAKNVDDGVARLEKCLEFLNADQALTDTRRAALKRMIEDRIRVTRLSRDWKDDGDSGRVDAQIEANSRRGVEAQKQREAEKVAAGLNRVGGLVRDGKIDEAGREASDLSRRFPGVPATDAARQVTSTAQQIIESRRLQEERARRMVAVGRDVERSATPVLGVVEFPKDWKEKTAKRTEVKMTVRERSLLRALSTPISVNFDKSRFEDAIEYLQTITGQSIVLDQQAMDEAQVGYDSPVTMRNKNVTFRTVLRKILSEVGLTYIVKEGSIFVTSPLKARETMTVRAYYLGDIIASFDPRFDLVTNQINALQAAQGVIDMITSTVDPGSWQQNNGPGTITFDPRTLSIIVKQTAEVHYMLGGGIR